ncbi:MAG: DUF1697 domain-containing protein [Taibaiella sp.]|nr:DUF1697 domain-containing protein [Taibaiella sp.]
MTRYVALLRGINVAGQKSVKMDALKTLFTANDFSNVATYIQSGNVFFDAAEEETGCLTQRIESMLKESLGFHVTTIVRKQAEIEKVIAANPYSESVTDENLKVYVCFLSALPEPEKIPPMKSVLVGGEDFTVIDRELYLITPAYGNTKLSNSYIEKKLALQSTARNWATVNKLASL